MHTHLRNWFSKEGEGDFIQRQCSHIYPPRGYGMGLKVNAYLNGKMVPMPMPWQCCPRGNIASRIMKSQINSFAFCTLILWTWNL
jgi:hypothetical protein